MTATLYPVSGATGTSRCSPLFISQSAANRLRWLMATGFVFHAAPADLFTRMRTHPAAGQRQGIPFLDGENRLLVAAFPDMFDVGRNIDLSRAFLTARRQAVRILIEMKDLRRRGNQRNDASRAIPDTCAASPAEHRIEYGQVVGTHRNGSERAAFYARAVPQAPLSAKAWSRRKASEQRGNPGYRRSNTCPRRARPRSSPGSQARVP